MNKEAFEKIIKDSFGVIGDHPFNDDFVTTVYRQPDNKKWFGIMMHIPKRRLGLNDDSLAYVVNLKCGTEMIPSLIEENGIFPAYHMNKRHWVSVILDDSIDLDTITFLLNVSFELTKTKGKMKK